MSLWKTIKIYRVHKKKNIPTIFLDVGAKKFANNCSLLFKMSTSGKQKRLLQKITRLDQVLPRNQVSETNFLSSCKQISVLCVHSLKNMLFLYLSFFQLSRGEKNKTVTYITYYIIRSLSVLFPFTRSTKCSNGIWFRGYGLPSLCRSKH